MNIFLCCDCQRIEPYAMGSTARMNGDDSKSNSGGSSVLTEDKVKANLGRLSISNSDPVKETRSLTRHSAQQSSDLNKDTKSVACKLLFLLFPCLNLKCV